MYILQFLADGGTLVNDVLEHTWCSGSTTASQAAGPGSIPGVCISFLLNRARPRTHTKQKLNILCVLNPFFFLRERIVEQCIQENAARLFNKGVCIGSYSFFDLVKCRVK